jgi:hypothetical protein
VYDEHKLQRLQRNKEFNARRQRNTNKIVFFDLVDRDLNRKEKNKKERKRIRWKGKKVKKLQLSSRRLASFRMFECPISVNELE